MGLYFWPTMKNEIKQMVESCPECVRMLPSQTAEEQIQTVTSTPMEAISVDLGERAGIHYLIGADRYSGWPFVTKLSNLVTQTITNALDDWGRTATLSIGPHRLGNEFRLVHLDPPKWPPWGLTSPSGSVLRRFEMVASVHILDNFQPFVLSHFSSSAKNTAASRSDTFYFGRCVGCVVLPKQFSWPLPEQRCGRGIQPNRIGLETP